MRGNLFAFGVALLLTNSVALMAQDGVICGPGHGFIRRRNCRSQRDANKRRRDGRARAGFR